MDRKFQAQSDSLVKKKSVETLEFFSNAGLEDVILELHENLQERIGKENAEEAIQTFKKLIASNSRAIESASLAYMALLVLVITQANVEAEEKYSRIKEISDFCETIQMGMKAIGERWGIGD
jgi:hypothetical protein